jgi:flagella basal body P-ring formation protein FlgA
MAGAIATVVLAASAAAMLTARPVVKLGSRDIRIGDVARVSGTARDRVAGVTIARLPASSARLSRAAIAALIRRAVQGIRVNGKAGGEILVIAAPAAGDERRCWQAARHLGAGDALAPADFRAAPCSASPVSSRIALDRSGGAVRATAEIEAGSDVGPLFIPSAPAVERGEKLLLIARDGPVTISRTVTAEEPARHGQSRLFVRTAEGEILSADLSGVAK